MGYSSNNEIFDGPLICDTAPQGMWFSGNTYQGQLTSQTIYPTERDPGDNGRVPAFRLDIKDLLCGPCPWTIYKVSETKCQYKQVCYIVVAKDSPQYYWCEDRYRTKQLKKLTPVPIKKRKRDTDYENIEVVQDEYVRLASYVSEDKKAEHSFASIDSASQKVIVNVFYAPPHLSEISINIGDFVSLKHIPINMIRKSPKLNSPFMPVVFIQKSANSTNDEIDHLLHDVGIVARYLNQFAYTYSPECSICHEVEEELILLPYKEVCNIFKYNRDLFDKAKNHECLRHDINLLDIYKQSQDEWRLANISVFIETEVGVRFGDSLSNLMLKKTGYCRECPHDFDQPKVIPYQKIYDYLKYNMDEYDVHTFRIMMKDKGYCFQHDPNLENLLDCLQ